MKQIILESLTLINFKGIRSFSISFDAETFIYGKNGTGKTTLNDAFVWLVSGKDSQERKDYQIKTLDAKNNPIQKLDHEVRGVFRVDGGKLDIRRIYREKWVKKKGSNLTEMTGHETDLYINDVPMQLKEFTEQMGEVFGSEKVFKMITNPLYFNSIDWTERRKILGEMAGEISDSDIWDKIATIENKGEVSNLINITNGGKSLEQYKKQIAVTKKKLQDDIKEIPTRIDEVSKTKPEPVDTAELEKQKTEKATDLNNIDKQIIDRGTASQEIFDKIQEKQGQISTLRTEIQQLKSGDEKRLREETTSIRERITNLESEIRMAEGDITRLNTENTRLQTSITNNNASITNKNGSLATKNNTLENLRNQWAEKNKEEVKIDEHDLNCPTCKRPLEDASSKEETLKTNFNTAKTNKLNDLQKSAGDIKQEISNLAAEIVELENENTNATSTITENKTSIDEIGRRIAGYKSDKITAETELSEYAFKEDPAIAEKEAEVKTIESTIPTKPEVNNQDLLERKKAIQAEFDTINKSLGTVDQIANVDARIKELEAEESQLAQQLADLEKSEFVIQQFSKTKIETIEQRTNGLFKYVSFKMFEPQINGGEAETCVCLLNGVPFPSVNTAGKILAGLDIINALVKYYQVSAPIFIDNRESTTEIIPCDSQIINLVVSPEVKTLQTTLN